MDDSRPASYRCVNQPAAADVQRGSATDISQGSTHRFVNQPGSAMVQRGDIYVSQRWNDQPALAAMQYIGDLEFMDRSMQVTKDKRPDNPSTSSANADSKVTTGRWRSQPIMGSANQHNGNVYPRTIYHYSLDAGARPMIYLREIERLYKACCNAIQHDRRIAASEVGIAWLDIIQPILQSLELARKKLEDKLEICKTRMIKPTEENESQLQHDLSSQARKLRRCYPDVEDVCNNLSEASIRQDGGPKLDQRTRRRFRSCYEKASESINEYNNQLDAQLAGVASADRLVVHGQ